MEKRERKYEIGMRELERRAANAAAEVPGRRNSGISNAQKVDRDRSRSNSPRREPLWTLQNKLENRQSTREPDFLFPPSRPNRASVATGNSRNIQQETEKQRTSTDRRLKESAAAGPSRNRSRESQAVRLRSVRSLPVRRDPPSLSESSPFRVATLQTLQTVGNSTVLLPPNLWDRQK